MSKDRRNKDGVIWGVGNLFEPLWGEEGYIAPAERKKIKGKVEELFADDSPLVQGMLDTLRKAQEGEYIEGYLAGKTTDKAKSDISKSLRDVSKYYPKKRNRIISEGKDAARFMLEQGVHWLALMGRLRVEQETWRCLARGVLEKYD